MLTILATHYVSPLSEVEFTNVPLTVHLANVADATGLVTGHFRVYNDTTGLLIHTSDIAPLTLAAGAGIDVSALTDFSPPAPIDDVYFVIFDGTAVNSLVPESIPISLGAFHFDVKPGALGDPPAAHAPTHEKAGADPIETSDLGTSELDTTLHLKPDGAGGLIWTSGITGFDHGALLGLADDDHTQYVLRTRFRVQTDFPEVFGINVHGSWSDQPIASGTVSTLAALPNHPGIKILISSTSANSGRKVVLENQCLSLAGSETTDFVFRPQSLPNTTLRFGLHDSLSASDAVDGCYLESVSGTLSGKTSSNSVRSTTGTNYLLVTNTWYRARITVNAAADRVDFYLFSEAGALLWSDNLTTNIPSGVGRETGHSFIATNSDTSAVTLVHLDYMSVQIDRDLVR